MFYFKFFFFLSCFSFFSRSNFVHGLATARNSATQHGRLCGTNFRHPCNHRHQQWSAKTCDSFANDAFASLRLNLNENKNTTLANDLAKASPHYRNAILALVTCWYSNLAANDCRSQEISLEG